MSTSSVFPCSAQWVHAVHENPRPLQLPLALDFALHDQTPKFELHFQLHLLLPAPVDGRSLRGDAFGSFPGPYNHKKCLSTVHRFWKTHLAGSSSFAFARIICRLTHYRVLCDLCQCTSHSIKVHVTIYYKLYNTLLQYTNCTGTGALAAGAHSGCLWFGCALIQDSRSVLSSKNSVVHK